MTQSQHKVFSELNGSKRESRVGAFFKGAAMVPCFLVLGWFVASLPTEWSLAVGAIGILSLLLRSR